MLRRLPKIFISYRRDDAGGYARSLYDALLERFGVGSVFFDLDIPVGADFAEEIRRAVGSCDILLALIGERWLDAVDERSGRRLEDPDDVLRLELEAALARTDVILIPVVLNRAEVPRADALPDSLKPLVQRQGFRVRSDRWHDDVRALVDAISRRLVETHKLGPIEGNPGRLRVLVDEGEWLRLQRQAARARAAKKRR